jgi:hypothetical protein
MLGCAADALMDLQQRADARAAALASRVWGSGGADGSASSLAWSCRTNGTQAGLHLLSVGDSDEPGLNASAPDGLSERSMPSMGSVTECARYSQGGSETRSMSSSSSLLATIASSESLCRMPPTVPCSPSTSTCNAVPALPLARLHQASRDDAADNTNQTKGDVVCGDGGDGNLGSERDRFINALARSKALNYANHAPQQKTVLSAMDMDYAMYSSSHWRERAADLMLV